MAESAPTSASTPGETAFFLAVVRPAIAYCSTGMRGTMLRYGQDAVELADGDLLIAFTDGVSEAMNAVREEFGEVRLTKSLAGGTPRHDDVRDM